MGSLIARIITEDKEILSEKSHFENCREGLKELEIQDKQIICFLMDIAEFLIFECHLKSQLDKMLEQIKR